MNNRIEQDHRGIKQRYYPMRGFAGPSTLPHVSAPPTTNSVTTSARVHAATTLSPSPTNAACSGDRWGEVCALLQAA